MTKNTSKAFIGLGVIAAVSAIAVAKNSDKIIKHVKTLRGKHDAHAEPLTQIKEKLKPITNATSKTFDTVSQKVAKKVEKARAEKKLEPSLKSASTKGCDFCTGDSMDSFDIAGVTCSFNNDPAGIQFAIDTIVANPLLTIDAVDFDAFKASSKFQDLVRDADIKEDIGIVSTESIAELYMA